MNWAKEDKMYVWGQYQIKKMASKWVVFMVASDSVYPIHKASSLKGAKAFVEKHYFRVA